ncbi:MAG: IS1595 family transposase [Bacteroidetes bacterium]|nr:IS1595 family transposase [Bacteroidota bacterium]MBT4409747.1 IS1595 family transposase [Bacteroidota bacterium]MBT4970692.1 IS1595 family transposase [Bacteroidota bacterium]MBT7093917.1 IS1595 family transposase [Bacteroidota bacterium]MBT7462536.1 IS1595 family transposase [Bacteroidota bacterium]
MKLIEFIQHFPDEQSCREAFRDYRLKAGLQCRKCGGTKHYWMKSIEQFQCKERRTRTTLRKGTVMEDSNLPFQTWFIAIHLMTSVKKPISAKEMQRQLGYKRYEPIWYMMQKIRTAMGSRDESSTLSGMVEIDEGFFTTVDSENRGKRKQKLKRGRGSQKQTPVLVMAETKTSKSRKKGCPAYSCKNFKLTVMEDQTGETINDISLKSLDPNTRAMTDNARAFSKLDQVVRTHKAKTIKPKDAGKELPWVHIAISNAKRCMLSAYHHVDDKYLQNYLNEYTYKLNRRYFGDKLFERLLIACISFSWFI